MTLPNYIAYFIIFGGWSIPAWLIWRICASIKRRKKSTCGNRRTNHLKIGITENGLSDYSTKNKNCQTELII